MMTHDDQGKDSTGADGVKMLAGLVRPVTEPESQDYALLVVPATYKPCAHGGGWWVSEDVDGCRVLFGSETPALDTDAIAALVVASRRVVRILDLSVGTGRMTLALEDAVTELDKCLARMEGRA